jgi:hypothetical protein
VLVSPEPASLESTPKDENVNRLIFNPLLRRKHGRPTATGLKRPGSTRAADAISTIDRLDELAKAGRQRVERFVQGATRHVALHCPGDRARGPRHVGVMDAGVPGEPLHVLARPELDRDPAWAPAVVEDSAQQLRNLSGEMRGNRDRQPVPQRTQPGAQNPVGQPPVVGGKFVRDPGSQLLAFSML